MSTPRTPRLRSAYPQSPQQGSQTTRSASPSANRRPAAHVRTSRLGPAHPDDANRTPLISLTTLDAPSQRFYAAAFYFALTGWQFYDRLSVQADEANYLWLFLKWTVIHGLFLFGLPSLRIPWLEPSTTTLVVAFFAQTAWTALLMFRVPIPIETWLLAASKIFWDREIAISERSVKAASLIRNSSLILGKQIINILPEGSAGLNPGHEAFCLGRGQSTVSIPLFLNQTVPTSIQLLRSNPTTNELESVIFSAKEVKQMRKEAERSDPRNAKSATRTWRVPVKQAGMYRLGRVLDESNLEVQKTHSEALVVKCPSASIQMQTEHRCKGELSNFFIEVDATPPLKIWYTRTINRGDDTAVSLTWHPEDLDSPLLGRGGSGPIVRGGHEIVDLSWARNRKHQIAVNETMSVSGGWQYHIDKVQDGCGNIVSYFRKDEEKQSRGGHDSHLEKDFIVHERPRARLADCSPQTPKRVASGSSSLLAVTLNPLGHHDTKASRHTVGYKFSTVPDDASETSVTSVREDTFIITGSGQGPVISEPGIYSLVSVSTEQCSGEILEPASCLLINPPKPDVSISSEQIPDKCAGNSVGILANLDLVGSPPFTIRYTEQRRGAKAVKRSERIDTLRHQFIFEPKEAGHYTYHFLDVSDSVYKHPQSLRERDYKLEQDIKPTAWASFKEPQPHKSVCLGQTAVFDVGLTGEGPWSLEYDLVHGKKRQKKHLSGLESSFVQLETPKLSHGGTYFITLSSVTDRSGCKIFLDQEARVDVRQQKPTVGFANIEGTRSIRALQHQKVRMPLRLSGERPWTVGFSQGNSDAVTHVRVESSNGFLETDQEGTFTLRSVNDGGCPGYIDDSTATFTVQWIAPPTLKLVPSRKITESGSQYLKQAVCEGEQDSFEVALSGNKPYQLRYEVHEHPGSGQTSSQKKQETYASDSALIRMQTSRAGLYKYVIADVGDHFYDLGSKRSAGAITIQQKINARPNAVFTHSGKIYSYCKEDDAGNEVIPVTLTGKPPFTLEIGIKHQTSSKPELITIPDIPKNSYDIQVPRSSLSLGGYSVNILRVVDGNGCQQVKQRSDRDLVHVNVVDVPTITPMESKTDFCVGDRLSYSLSGTAPFNVFYTFREVAQKAAVSNTNFRRLAEKPGVFTINAVSDRASTDACRARTNITKVIHELPSVRISKGKTYEVDIHEGGEAEILFEFGGSPPFEFTYTRSTNAARGKKSVVLETKHDVSHDHVKAVRAFEEGTYEVVAIRDRYCGVTMHGKLTGAPSEQKLLT